MTDETKSALKQGADQVIPLKAMRGMIADKMHQSLMSTAQLTHHAECEATALLSRKEKLASEGKKVSVEDLLLQTVVTMLQCHPVMNGLVKDNEIRLSSNVDIGIAIALPGNLLVAPALFQAEKLSLEELSTARKELIAKARAKKLSVTELTGGTFTVSNLGLSRVRFFTPILNAPQIAILGVGQITEQARSADNGTIEMRPVMGLSMTFDHRAVDGAPAAAFLSDLCQAIESLA
jgi:pyruvate dehydrogenase E2 component (dihydrolipoamide acetyltransferase)